MSNLLIPYGGPTDVHFIEAAHEMGHKVVQMSNFQEVGRQERLMNECGADHFQVVPSRFELDLNHAEYMKAYKRIIRGAVEMHDIDAILPTSSLGFVMEQVADVNAYFGLPGIQPHHADLYNDKTEYLPLFADAGVLVPEIYEIVPAGQTPSSYDIPYPAIAKPGLGSGGYGVYVATNEERMRWFFSSSDNPDAFGKRALFYQDKDEDGNPRCYVHFGMGGRYLVQEYMPGPCISLVGHANEDGVPQLDLAYDITVTAVPYCSEIAFGYPSRFEGVEEAAEDLVESMAEVAEFPPGAWMADAIYSDGSLYLVDLACRASSSGTKMLSHVSEDRNQYPRRVIEAVLDGQCGLPPEPVRDTFYSFIPFHKGKIVELEYPDLSEIPNRDGASIVEIETPLEEGERVSEMRNDVQVADRGFVVAEAESGKRKEAEALVADYLNTVRYGWEP